VVAAVFSLLVLIRMFLVRRQRRGFGLALVAFVFLWASTAFFSAALETAQDPAAHGAWVQHRHWTPIHRTLHRERFK
jgi:hypothetical protein